MAYPVYSGDTDKDCYSDILAHTTGSFYDVMKQSVFICIDEIFKQRPKDSVLTLADFGTGDGVCFLYLLEDILRHIEHAQSGRVQLLVYLQDMPNNDFNLLQFKYTNSNLAFLKKGVFYATIGKTMYSQCLPAESVDIVLSSAAVHWLSNTPCYIKNGLNFVHADDHERELFRQQAKEDWKIFLLSRGTELKRGGNMVITIPTSQDGEAGLNLMIYCSEVWKKMFSQGKISKEEFRRTTQCFYRERTEEDLRLPFDEPEIGQLGLRVVSINLRRHDLIMLKQKLQNNDKSVYAAAVADMMRPILRNVIYNGLAEGRTAHEKKTVVEEFFTMLRNEVCKSNDQFEYFIRMEVVIKKD